MCHPTRQSAAGNRAGLPLCVLTAGVLLLATVGCSKAGHEQENSGSAAQAGPGAAQALPAAQVDANTPTVESRYPQLASAGLVHARLAALPAGVLLQAGSVTITQEQVEAEIAKSPVEIQGQLRTNAFFLLEQMATRKLLVQEARQKTGKEDGDENALLPSYFSGIVSSAEVTDREVAEFYEHNREMVGGMPLTQVAPQIKQYLLQGKQQEIVERHIQTLGKRTPIAVSATWTELQALLARDNSVDRARANGKPTFASFGADTCIPCQKMVPVRQAVGEKYEGKINVVYVHVGKEQVLASRYGVEGIPLLLFFDADGREVLRHAGMMSQEQIEQHLKQMGVQ
jgi:thioredoxin 1